MMTADNVKTDDGAAVKCSITCSTGETSDSGTLETDVFGQHGEKVFTFTATDSRGRTSQTTGTLLVEKYDDPSVTVTVLKRVNRNDDGTYTEAEDGNCFEIQTVHPYTSCKGQNSITRTVQYKTVSGELYSEETPLENGLNIIEIAEAYRGDEALNVRVNITDSLGNSNFAEGILPGTSILVHITNKGKSIGVKCYNFLMNSIKFGLDVYIGEDKLEDFVKALMGDFVVASGTINGTKLQFNHTDANDIKTGYEFETEPWEYRIWNSGKIEIWSQCEIAEFKPNKVGYLYQGFNVEAPALSEIDKKINTDNFVLIESNFVVNEAGVLIKGTKDGFSNNSFRIMYHRTATWDSLDVRMDFHFVLLPKE